MTSEEPGQPHKEAPMQPQAARAYKKLRIAQERIEAQIRRQKALLKQKARSRDTRQKVLIGALMLQWMQADEDFQKRVYQALDRQLHRPVDRAVFSLPMQPPQSHP